MQVGNLEVGENVNVQILQGELNAPTILFRSNGGRMNKLFGLFILVLMFIPNMSNATPAEVIIAEKDGKKSEAIRLEMLVVHATTSNTVDPQVTVDEVLSITNLFLLLDSQR